MNATELERGCVVLDQRQHVGRAGTSDLFQRPLMTKLLRLVCDTEQSAGKKGSIWQRNPGVSRKPFTTFLNPNPEVEMLEAEPNGCRADILVCRFAELSSSASGDWKVARTGRLESLPYAF